MEAATHGHSDRQTLFAARMMDCVSRAFREIGTSPIMEDFLYWDLANEQRIGLNEILDRPQRFVEALKTVFGEAGAAVYEYKLVQEIQKEFDLVRPPAKEDLRKRRLGELLQAAVSAAWMAPSA